MIWNHPTPYHLGGRYRECSKEVSGRTIGTYDTNFVVAYDTSLAPGPTCYVANTSFCYFDIGSGSDGWLWMAFDFVVFMGSSIPGTAVEARVTMSEQGSVARDRLGDALESDWYTSFGEMYAQDRFLQFWSDSPELFDLPYPIVPQSGSYFGDVVINQNRFGRINHDETTSWGVSV